MSNKLKRYSKQQRQSLRKQTFTLEQMNDIRVKEHEKAEQYAFESLAPLFCLYLVENFHCKNDGVWKFMDWFNKTFEWLDKYPQGFEEIRQELKEKAGVTIKY